LLHNWGSNVRVYSRVSLFGASVSPRDDTDLNTIDGDGTTRVSLAGVFSFFTGADHTCGDLDVIAVSGSTFGMINNWDIHDVEGLREVKVTFLHLEKEKILLVHMYRSFTL